MFGLMRAKKCGLTAEEKNIRRLHYCGTCKTLGSLYGQKSRLLLNNDTVFLAEILTGLTGENAQEWEASYQSFNCLRIPRADLPIALQLAATANVVLTEFKISDHIADEKQRRYRAARNFFSKEFSDAASLLKRWNFPLEEVRAILQTQAARESESDSLEILAHPSAEATAVFFSEGARLIGRTDEREAMREIGYRFGKLVYLLDAFEDYEKDFRTGKFNAFRRAYHLPESQLPAAAKRKISSQIRKIESELIETIAQLPISPERQKIFSVRLSANVARKLKTGLPVIQTERKHLPKSRQTFAQRWRTASDKARNLTRDFSWQMPLVFFFIFTLVLVAPAQSRSARSARECFDLSFNLMFLGSLLGSVMVFPKALMQGFEPPPPPPPRPRQPPPSQDDGSSGGYDGCCDGCCDSCDCGCCCAEECGCCDGCNCCDGCDCCGCDC